MKRKVQSGIICLVLFFASASTWSAEKEKIILQFSEDEPKRQTLVLNVAENLINLYGENNVDIEVVAFGPGLKLLYENNKNARRIDDLALKDVRFSACNVTIGRIEKKTGKKPKLHPQAKIVRGGVPRIIELTKQGYLLFRP